MYRRRRLPSMSGLERPNNLFLGAAAVIGSYGGGDVLDYKLKGNEDFLRETRMFSTLISASPEQLLTIVAKGTGSLQAQTNLQCKFGLDGYTPKHVTTESKTYCRKFFISSVTGVFMHGLYNNFEYPVVDPTVITKGIKFLEKSRYLTNEAGADVHVGIGAKSDGTCKLIDRTLVGETIQAISLYGPSETDRVEGLWKKFGIQLSDDLLRQWKCEFYLAGHYCVTGNCDDLFLPLQFGTAILQICDNIHESWTQWAKYYASKKQPDSITEDVNAVILEQRECFKRLAQMFVNFSTVLPNTQNCPDPKKKCAFACCHCFMCCKPASDNTMKPQTQNDRFQCLVKVKSASFNDSSIDAATQANCKKQVTQSLVLWLSQCIMMSPLDIVRSSWVEGSDTKDFGFQRTRFDTFLARSGVLEALTFELNQYSGQTLVNTIPGYELTLPRWYYVMYGLPAPPAPDESNKLEVEKHEPFTVKLLIRAFMSRDNRNMKNELEWIRNLFPIPVDAKYYD